MAFQSVRCAGLKHSTKYVSSLTGNRLDTPTETLLKLGARVPRENGLKLPETAREISYSGQRCANLLRNLGLFIYQEGLIGWSYGQSGLYPEQKWFIHIKNDI